MKVVYDEVVWATTDAPAPSAVPILPLPQERSSPARKHSPTARAGQRGGPRTTSLRRLVWFVSWRALVAEFVATSLLVGLGCSASNGAWAFGILVLANTIVFGSVSGAHMNPAISLAAAITEHLSWRAAGAYMLAQFTGAVAGTAILVGSGGGSGGSCFGCTLPGVQPLPAVLLELGITFMLVLVCCTTWASKDGQSDDDGVAPFKIGLVVAGLIFVSSSATGGSLNPARSFGPALMNWCWEDHWIYWLGPFSGAASAALLYRFVMVPILRLP